MSTATHESDDPSPTRLSSKHRSLEDRGCLPHTRSITGACADNIDGPRWSPSWIKPRKWVHALCRARIVLMTHVGSDRLLYRELLVSCGRGP